MHPRAQISGANEMSQLRFHWDFLGPDAPTTAEHFLEHLEDFCAREGIEGRKWSKPNPPARYTVVLECEERHLAVVRGALKPVRGERVLE